MIDIEPFVVTWRLLCVTSGEIQTRTFSFSATVEKEALLEILIHNC